MKEKIKELRESGLSIRKIAKELNCSKGKVVYALSPSYSKEKKQEIYDKQKISRAKNPLLVKCGEFRKPRKGIGEKPDEFFNHKDVIAKFGQNTNCYLTGDPIDLMINNYNFDHIIPCAMGGKGNLSNLGITTPEANFAKGSLSLEQFLNLCKKVLLHNGYKVEKNEEK